MKAEVYLPIELADRWEKFKKICKREGSSASEKLREFIMAYVDAHDHGNPQTLLDRYSKGGPTSTGTQESPGPEMNCDLCNPWGICLSLGSPCTAEVCPRRQPGYKSFLSSP